MMEYFGYKKYKKHKAEKEAREREEGKSHDNAATKSENVKPEAASSKPVAAAVPTTVIPAPPTEAPVLTSDDEHFLMRLTSDEEDRSDDVANRPALPPRVKTPEIPWDSDDESVAHLKVGGKGVKGKEKATDKADKKLNRFSSIFKKKDSKQEALTKANLDPNHLALPDPETDREKDDLSRVLDDLNLSARNNTAFSLNKESSELVRKFTLVLKDLVNGVPTAVGDLQRLIEDKDGTIAKQFDKLPGSMKKLVTQLPNKLTAGLGPEIAAIAAASAAEATAAEEAGKSKAKGGIAGAAKKLLVPKNLQDLVTKPGAIVGLLKGIMNALKLRWPAFIGTNVIWSVAIFCKLIPALPLLLSCVPNLFSRN
jgi:hypothetical protein